MKRMSVVILSCAMMLAMVAACSDKAEIENVEYNFYGKRLRVVTDILNKECGEIEPNLMTNNIDVVFYSDGLIRSISGYIYGFDENYKLTSGYAIDYSVTGKLFVHKQDFNGKGSVEYELDNDFEQLCSLIDLIDMESVVSELDSEICGLLSKGIRDFGYDDTNLTEITRSGELVACDAAHRETPFKGQSFSLYVSGRSHELYRRYIYMDETTFNLSGE